MHTVWLLGHRVIMGTLELEQDHRLVLMLLQTAMTGLSQM